MTFSMPHQLVNNQYTIVNIQSKQTKKFKFGCNKVTLQSATLDCKFCWMFWRRMYSFGGLFHQFYKTASETFCLLSWTPNSFPKRVSSGRKDLASHRANFLLSTDKWGKNISDRVSSPVSACAELSIYSESGGKGKDSRQYNKAQIRSIYMYLLSSAAFMTLFFLELSLRLSFDVFLVRAGVVPELVSNWFSNGLKHIYATIHKYLTNMILFKSCSEHGAISSNETLLFS